MIHPTSSAAPWEATCLMNYGGYTFIQYRSADCETSGITFDRSWSDYQNGFWIDTCFWQGLDRTHELTNQAGVSSTLDVVLRKQNYQTCAPHQSFYTGFRIGDALSKYQLDFDSFADDWTSCGAGDSLMVSGDAPYSARGMEFSTPDRDNDNSAGHCAQEMGSGWWFNNCSVSNLNGEYTSSTLDGMRASAKAADWRYDMWDENLKFTGMMVRSKKIIA